MTVGGRRTSMRLEPQMWDAIETIAKLEGMSINRLCAEIDQRRRDVGLTSATRVFIISYYRQLVRSYEGQGLGPNGNGSLARIVLDSVVGKPIDRVTALRPVADRNLAVTGED
ncbi:ribbon-helix-helix domain-containing protein [Thalassobaculum sp.]|uniref:ribbon-helix-helix domain-containing protein n=1 Tax=Thalassobaculum sp. TaxID=2022740 RepID=UPI0032EBFF06